MSALAEFAAAVVAWLIEVSIYIARFALAPLKFIFSPRYRTTTQARWHGHPGRRATELISGSLALLLFVGMLSWWTFVLTRPEGPSPHFNAADLERRVFEKIRDFRSRQP